MPLQIQAVPLVITLILTGLWALRPGPVVRWLTLAWLGLNLLGAVVTVLPLGMLPFDPEQSWAHYSSHLVYALAQLPGCGCSSVTRGKTDGLIDQRGRALNTRADATSRRLLPFLPAIPLIDSASTAAAVGVSWRAALSALKAQEAAGIVEQVEIPSSERSGAGRPQKRYLAVRVLALLET